MSVKGSPHDLCSLEDIREPGSRGFELNGGGPRSVKLFVVRKDGVLAAYRNRCPHTGAPLEWLPNQFLDMDNSFIQCAIHGALFRPEDGYCVRGPCMGASLEGLQLKVVDDRVQVCLPTNDPQSDPDFET